MAIVGHSHKIQCTFYAEDGVTPTNPTDFTLEIFRQDSILQMTPLDSVTKSQCESDETGVFYYWFLPTQSGMHWAQFKTIEDDGVPRTAKKLKFDVDMDVTP